MRFLRPFALFITFICGACMSQAQELEPALPGRLTLFRPLTGAYEGYNEDFPLRASVSATVGYDDNVLTSQSDRIGSGYDYGGVEIASRIGAERTRLTGDLQLGALAYWNSPAPAIE